MTANLFEELLNKKLLAEELPFYLAEDLDVKDLLSDSPFNKNFNDNFIAFHSIKLCTSNAKQMSKLFQLSMGFEEVAYKGLENDSRILGSHVVRNGDVIIEFINTLETVEENPSDLPLGKDQLKEDFNSQKSFSEEFKIIYLNLIRQVLESKLIKTDSQKQKMVDCVSLSTDYRDILKDQENNFQRIQQKTISVAEDLVDSFKISEFVQKHGEGIMDISFLVEDVEKVFHHAISNGAEIYKQPRILLDQNGSVKVATICIPSTDIYHTLIENINYNGPYLPNYSDEVTLNQVSKNNDIKFIGFDHCVVNVNWDQMMDQVMFYAKAFGFSKFWSVDEAEISTGNSGLNSLVMASSNGKIKMPINEPAKALMKSQIEEFYDFHGGSGIQHFAIKTNNIITCVEQMKLNGVSFNEISDSYYETLAKRLSEDDIKLREDLNKLKKLHILVDYDKNSRNKKTKYCDYILQIFTNPLHDRPTFFIEIIQRYHHQGFGKGTFKGLFETIENDQKKRGNLVPSKV